MVRTLWLPFVLLLAAPAGAGVSFSGTLYNAPDVPNGIVSADLNRDGLPDMAIASGNTISVYLATSPGKFGAETDYPIPGVPEVILSADFNGDGALDLIVNEQGLPQLSILWNNGNGTFRPGPIVKLGAPAISFDLGDFNHDGLLDIATVENGSMNSYRGKGNGVFTKVQSVNLPVFPGSQTEVADLNGDSIPDLAVSTFAQVLIWWGKGDATFSGPTHLSPNDGNDIQSFAVADFTNDSRLDVVVNTGTNLSSMGCLGGSSWFYKNLGAKKFSLLWSSPGGCSFLNPIDMNGDLNKDLIYQNGDPNLGFFAGELGNGNGTFRAPTNPSFPNQVGGPIYVRDIDLDSRDDFIVEFAGTNASMVALQTGGSKSCKPPGSAKLTAKVCAPVAGATVPSPVLVQAAGNSPAGVIQLQVWIDGVKKAVKWHDELSKKFSLASGTHRIAVVATDKYLGATKTSINITVP